MSEDPSPKQRLFKAVKIVLLVFALLLAGIAVTAYVAGGEQDTIPFEYDGFD